MPTRALKNKKYRTRKLAVASCDVERIVHLSSIQDEKAGGFLYGTFFSKAVSATLIVFLGIGILNVEDTKSYYNDFEKSEGNAFTAGPLDFVLTDSGFDPIEASLNFQFGTTTRKTIGMALVNESNPIKYTASTTNLSGDIPFCEAIDVNASLASTSQFLGKLPNFSFSPTTTVADWQYDFSIGNSPSFYNSLCTFAFEYNGRQTDPHSEYNPGGYYDIETATSTLYSWGFRINKIYYDVDSAHGEEGDNEWVEIYNQTDSALDIKDWQICDNNSCDTLASTSPLMIPAQGFAVITASSTTWNYWDMPSDILKIELGEDIGNGLSNMGDRLILKRPDGAVMDEMNWQNDAFVWNPGSVDVPEGHTLGRKPNGYDTNQPSDFVDLALPLILLTNPDQSGNQIWYWTYLYDIMWSATNPNGPDSDLSIDLYYIKDSDGTATITPDDETLPIAVGLSNSGSYQWELPSGFLGYIWVKAIARGPENPMLNARMISGKVYDPFPIELWLTDPEAVLESLIEVRPFDLMDLEGATATPEIISEIEGVIASSTPEEAVETTVGGGGGETGVIGGDVESENIVVDGTLDMVEASTTEEIIPDEEPVSVEEELSPVQVQDESVLEETMPNGDGVSAPQIEPAVLPDPAPIDAPVAGTALE